MTRNGVLSIFITLPIAPGGALAAGIVVAAGIMMGWGAGCACCCCPCPAGACPCP